MKHPPPSGLRSAALGEWLSWRATFWFVGGFGPSCRWCRRSLGNQPPSQRQVDLASSLRGEAECRATATFLRADWLAMAIHPWHAGWCAFILQDRWIRRRNLAHFKLLSIGGLTAGTFTNNRLAASRRRRPRAPRAGPRLAPIVMVRSLGRRRRRHRPIWR
jgi:hypothetical protein